jgi:hypothetical protein
MIRELNKMGKVLGKNKTFLKKNQNLLFNFIFYSDFNNQAGFSLVVWRLRVFCA